MLGESSSSALVMESDDMLVDSPFKSPRVNSLPNRSRLGSGSSVSSLDSPRRYQSTTQLSTPTSNNDSSKNAQLSTRDENHVRSHGAPGGERVNPFESDILAGLEKSFCSPSLMQIQETPPQQSWGIEHLANLFPKDIENSPSTHQNAYPVDPQAEAKAQADIDTYFNRGPIVPSPSPLKERQVNGELMRLNKPIVAQHLTCGQSPVARGGNSSKKSSANKKLKPYTDRWTQTSLSFPENLPPQLEQILCQYSQLQNGEALCGSGSWSHSTAVGETSTSIFSQKLIEVSDNVVYCDNNDSGKNSSYHNNSIRRRLELSFGEDPEDNSNSNDGPCPPGGLSPIADRFGCNRMVSTPPSSSSSNTLLTLNTTTSELEIQLMRCEFTPESTAGTSSKNTPGLTPIHNVALAQTIPEGCVVNPNYNSANCSTPRRVNSTTGNPRRTAKNFKAPLSPPANSGLRPDTQSKGNPERTASSSKVQNLRRSREISPRRPVDRITSSISSFDDSNLFMSDSPKPAKLQRRSAGNEIS